MDFQGSINRNSEKIEKTPESCGTEENLPQTTPKRAVPSISFDQFREEESLHTRRRSGDFTFTTDIPAPKKPQNPRILILDFKETNASNVQLVRRALITYTEIRNFSIKVLLKGGISILFAKPKARDFAEKVLTEKLGSHLATRRGFLKNKKVFEVITTVQRKTNLKLPFLVLTARTLITQAKNVFFTKIVCKRRLQTKRKRMQKPLKCLLLEKILQHRLARFLPLQTRHNLNFITPRMTTMTTRFSLLKSRNLFYNIFTWKLTEQNWNARLIWLSLQSNLIQTSRSNKQFQSHRFYKRRFVVLLTLEQISPQRNPFRNIRFIPSQSLERKSLF